MLPQAIVDHDGLAHPVCEDDSLGAWAIFFDGAGLRHRFLENAKKLQPPLLRRLTNHIRSLRGQGPSSDAITSSSSTSSHLHRTNKKNAACEAMCTLR